MSTEALWLKKNDPKNFMKTSYDCKLMELRAEHGAMSEPPQVTVGFLGKSSTKGNRKQAITYIQNTPVMYIKFKFNK